MTKYKILGWNLGVSDDPAHPMKRYTIKFPFETYSVNGHDKQVKIPECTYINDFRDEGAFEKVFDLHWLKWEIAKNGEGSNQSQPHDLKMYLANSIEKTARKISEIQMTQYDGIPTDKYEIGRLEAYQEILKKITE